MNINKNISIWRGDSTPPTNYHFWIKSNGLLFTFNGERWVNYVEDIPTASLESKGLMSSLDKVNLEECVLHLEDTSNPHHVSKELIGLGNVTNDAQVKRSELGVTVATLNDNGKVAESLLPSYVDDILEGQLVSVTEFTLNAGLHGEVKLSGVIYLDTTTNTSYRWSGSQYVMTGSSLTLGEGEDLAFPGNRGVNLENLSAVTSLLSETSEDKVTIKVTLKSLDGKSESTDNVDIQTATTTKAGVMSAADKAALDELPTSISEAEISSISNTLTANDVTIETLSANQRLTTTIPYATSTTAGVMSAEDKVEVNKIKDKADKVELKAISDKVDTIIVPTKVSELTNDLAFQTKTEVNTAIQKVVGAAPEALDTLEEIATKLSDNADAVAGIVNTLSDKANVGDSYTKTESDAKYLTTSTASDTYLPKATYTASDILTKIKTVDGTGSGLDADTVDGYLASDFIKSVGSVSTAEVAMNADEIPLNSVLHDYRWSNAPYNTAIASILDLSYSPDWRTQLFTYHSRLPALYTRSRYSGTTWGDWRQLAFTNSNVASATKLATPHTIWGQSFDGTANVGGSLSGVEDIIFNADAKITAKDLHLNILTKRGEAQGLASAQLLVSDTYPDWSKVPTNGIYSKGNIVTNGNVTATSFVKTGGTATQFLKADGSVDSNSYLLSSAYTAADILTKIKTVDGAGSGLDADTLDGVQGKDYMYHSAYNFENGCLVRLKLLTSGNDMVTVHIHGNSYNQGSMPIDTWVQFYNYNPYDAFINERALHNGYDFGNINVFCYDGHVYLWFKQTGVYQSFSVYAENTEHNHTGNLVEDITNAAMPTEGVTRLKTIVPMKSALTTDLSNVLKEDVVDGPVLEEIENLTKEELKAELLGDVDSKLVTKVDKVELDKALTAKQDKLVNSDDVTVGEDDKLTVTDAAVKKAFIKRWENLGTIYIGALRGTYDEETDLFTVMWNTKYPESRKYQPYFTYLQAMAALDVVTGPVLGYDSFALRIPANLPPIGYQQGSGPRLTIADIDSVVYNYTIKTLILSAVGPCTVSQTMVLSSANELQAIIGDVIVQTGIYENPISFSSSGLGFPKLEYFHITIKKSFDVRTSPLLTFSTMQYLVTKAANTSSITVTVHPDVYAKLTGDTTNAAASALTADELAQWQALVTTANSKHISFATTSN